MDGILNSRGDWTDPVSQQRYFDPCNYIYSRAFHLAFPDIVETLGNAETLGDTLKGLLALKYWDDHGAIGARNPPRRPESVQARNSPARL